MNVVIGTTVHGVRPNGHGVDTGWKTVESKQDSRSKRLQSRTSTMRNGNMSRVNGKLNGKRVKFDDSSNSLILF